MTAPTIGRVVYYRPSSSEISYLPLTVYDDQPLRADVCFVLDDGTVSLLVNDHIGRSFVFLNVPFFETRQTGDIAHAHWMPYQLATAAATGAVPLAAAAPIVPPASVAPEVPQPQAGQFPQPLVN